MGFSFLRPVGRHHRISDSPRSAPPIRSRGKASDEAMVKVDDPQEMDDELWRELEEELRNRASPLPRPVLRLVLFFPIHRRGDIRHQFLS